jgi:hypothetical protein
LKRETTERTMGFVEPTLTSRSERRPWRTGAVVVLWLAAIFLAVTASVLQPHDSPALSRFWSRVPGITDICGDFTWFARAIPPGLALLGAGLSSRAAGGGRVRVIMSIIGVLLAIGLAFAAFQNAVPWGELHCRVD